MRQILMVFCGATLLLSACNSGTKNETTSADSTSSSMATSSQESKEEKNKQVAMESIKAVIDRHPDDVFKNVTADAVDYGDGSGPVTKSLDSMKAGLNMWLNGVQDYKGDNLEAVADGNKVMVYGDWSGKFKNDFMGMKVAGKTFKARDVDIFTFNDEGKITEHRSVQSTAGLMASAK